MKKIFIIFIAFGIFACESNVKTSRGEKAGNYSGIIKYGNFADKILFEIESDSTSFKVFFSDGYGFHRLFTLY